VVHLGNQSKLIKDNKTEQNTILIYGAGFENNAKEAPACNLVFNALCSGFSTRLIKRIREELGLCYHIGIGQTCIYKGMTYPCILKTLHKSIKFKEKMLAKFHLLS